MKSARPQIAETSAGTAKFYIDNPRERHLLAVLLQRGETSRHDLDGLMVRIGFYSLSAADRMKAIAALKCGG